MLLVHFSKNSSSPYDVTQASSEIRSCWFQCHIVCVCVQVFPWDGAEMMFKWLMEQFWLPKRHVQTSQTEKDTKMPIYRRDPDHQFHLTSVARYCEASWQNLWRPDFVYGSECTNSSQEILVFLVKSYGPVPWHVGCWISITDLIWKLHSDYWQDLLIGFGSYSRKQ